MKRKLFAVLSAIVMCGCAADKETSSLPETVTSTAATDTTTTVKTTASAATTTTSETTPVTSYVEPEPDEVIPAAIQSPRVDGDRLSYTIMNVYSDGEYYTVDISGVKLGDEAQINNETTYIFGDIYGDFRLDLQKDGEMIDSMKINVPRDDRFLILESVKDGLSYGCELISNKRHYAADDHPDLIQLDFHIIDEGETPQYARFFAIFDGKLTEVPVYENGVETAPYGTHLEMLSKGVMEQHIVASDDRGVFSVIRYEYTFNIEERCLERQQTKFYG
ncbi:MAG: hypothetical protein J6A16_01815 [Oscillospiraceae bacterium]|nr:hypothetical protein [Oscillospiraceae bacterium]